MPTPCCAKPMATIIKVGTSEAGILGLEAALRNVVVSDCTDEERIKAELVRWVKEFGNYIAPSRETEYQEALFREYKKYKASVRHASTQPPGKRT